MKDEESSPLTDRTVTSRWDMIKIKIGVYSANIHGHMVYECSTIPFSRQGGDQCSLQLLIQPWFCASGTHFGWVDRGSVEYVCPTLLHMTSTGNRTPDPLILSPTPCLVHLATCSHLSDHSVYLPFKDINLKLVCNFQRLLSVILSC